MAKPQLFFPPRLRRIEREKADQVVRMSGHIGGDVSIVHPQAAEAGLASENDRPHRLRSGALVVLEPHRKVELDAGFRAARLLAKVVGEMLRVAPSVAMNV